MAFPNKEYHYQQTAASPAAGTAGYGIAILDACLVTGFNSKSISSISVTTNIATVTTSTDHGFVPDEIVLIAGANESIFNDEFKVLTIPTTTTFTFALTTGLTDATGTMSVKIAPLGWEKTYSGTNKAVYRSLDITGTRLYLRVDDTNAQYMRVNMYETMSSVDAGTGVSTTIYWKKSDTSSTAVRNWYLIGNSKVFYIMFGFYSTLQDRVNPCAFGDLITCKAGDAYHCMLIGPTINSIYQGADNSFPAISSTGEITGQYIARSYSQIGSNIQFYKLDASSNTRMGYDGVTNYPNGSDNGLHINPVYVYESATKAYRGIMPGLYAPFEKTSGAFNCRDKSVVIDGKTFIGYKHAVHPDGSYLGNFWFALDDAWE